MGGMGGGGMGGGGMVAGSVIGGGGFGIAIVDLFSYFRTSGLSQHDFFELTPYVENNLRRHSHKPKGPLSRLCSQKAISLS